MSTVGKFAPATPWRAFFVAAGLMIAGGDVIAAPPPSSAPPPLAQFGKPNAAESARILEQFQRSGWRGYVEFDLHGLPRRGEETVYHGRLWGGVNDQGAVSRIELTDGKGTVHRFLLQNGEHAAVWRVTAGQVAKVDTAALFQPLIPGVEVTPFDLQMPYLYWPGAKVESVTRVRGRPAYVFVFNAPTGFTSEKSPVTAVRAYFDAQFNSPVQIEQIAQEQVLKTTSLVDLKKVGEEWIPKSLDTRNELTRDKTRFEVTAVALNLEFASAVFAPATLAQEVHPPTADRIIRIEP